VDSNLLIFIREDSCWYNALNKALNKTLNETKRRYQESI